jgi:diketogulonate reductase-like aldo/keto reductase
MTQAASLSLRTLGNSDLQLTPIGFGAWAIGGGNWEFAWGPQDDNESIAAIHRALDLGVNWIDTAAIYGLGHSEEMVAAPSRASPGPSRSFLPSAPCAGTRTAPSTARSRPPRWRRNWKLAAPPWRRNHRPLPDPLANPEEEIEEGWETLARFGAGQDPLDRRLQFSLSSR